MSLCVGKICAFWALLCKFFVLCFWLCNVYFWLHGVLVDSVVISVCRQDVYILVSMVYLILVMMSLCVGKICTFWALLCKFFVLPFWAPWCARC